jgi:hypothetical protein
MSWPIALFLLCIGWPLAYALWSFLRAAWGPRRNRRLSRDAWPRPGTAAPKGFFADSTQRGGIECAGKVQRG